MTCFRLSWAQGRGRAQSWQSFNSELASSSSDEDDEGFDINDTGDLDDDEDMEEGDETLNDYLDEAVPAASILQRLRSAFLG